MKFLKNVFKCICVVAYCLAVILAATAAAVVNVFLGVLVFGICVVGTIWAVDEHGRKRNEREKNQRERHAEERGKQKQLEYADLFNLVEEYLRVPNHSVEETRQAWDRYNSLLQMYGVEKTGPVYQIYNNVFAFLKKEALVGLSAEGNKKWSDFYLEFADKLWEFYYRIAFTYDLAADNQEDLLRYILRCFVGQKEQDERKYFIFARGGSYDNFEWKQWGNKRLALWEKGVECGSAFAVFQLAECYYNYELVAQRDYDKAFALYQQAAQLGDMDALYKLGKCYENGYGTKKNFQKAGDCYQYGFEVSGRQEFAKALDVLYTSQRWNKNKYSPNIFNAVGKAMKKDNLQKLKDQVAGYTQMDAGVWEPRIVAISLRTVLEEIVNSFVECYESAYLNDDLSSKITLLRNKGYFLDDIAHKAHKVRKIGNSGAHNSGETITDDDVQEAVSNIQEILAYYEQY